MALFARLVELFLKAVALFFDLFDRKRSSPEREYEPERQEHVDAAPHEIEYGERGQSSRTLPSIHRAYPIFTIL